jgi:hypothetical protein
VGGRGVVRRYRRSPRSFWLGFAVAVLVGGIAFGNWITAPVGVGLYCLAVYRVGRLVRRRYLGRYRGHHSFTERLAHSNGFDIADSDDCRGATAGDGR